MMKRRLKEVSCAVLIFYGFLLFSRCFVFSAAAADTKDIHAKIFGTGPNKVWIDAGGEQGVVKDMIFDVKRGEELLARIKITKVGKSSSEGAVVELNPGKECAAGDTVKFYAMPKTETKIETKTATKTEEKKDEKPSETTSTATPPATMTETKTNVPKTETAPEVKKDATPATQPAVETKKEEPKTEPKKEEVKKTKSTAKKSKSFLNNKMMLYLIVIGGAAFALSGSGGKKGTGGGTAAVDPYTGVPDAPSISGVPGF